ncbi:MAG: rubrerythrin family protein [Caldisericaceae bacterium]
MKQMTERSLREAFAGESQAHMKYLIFADQAEKEGRLDLARLFRAISFAEQVHATNHFKALGDLKSTSENLQSAWNGENFEVEEMYPAYNAIASLQDENSAMRSIGFALAAEKIHRSMYADAKEKVDKGEDVKIDKISICPVCGYTVIGEAPEKCPVCGAPKSSFHTF